MANIFYFSTNEITLTHYFRRGCVVPSFVLPKDKIPDDVQKKANDYLLLTEDLNCLEKSSCVLEIFISDSEKENYLQKFKDRCFRFWHFLPVTRIKCMYFYNEEDYDFFKNTAERGDAYIPKHVPFKKLKKNKLKFAFKTIKKLKISNKVILDNLNYFEKLLGASTLCKIGAFDHSKYSYIFLNFASIFNKKIDDYFSDKLNKKYIKYFNSLLESEIFKHVLNNGITLDYVNKYIIEKKVDVNYDELLNDFDLSDLEKKATINKKDNVEKLVFSILLAYRYAAIDSPHRIDSYLFNQYDNNEINQFSLFFMGLSLGYSNLNNEYRLDKNKIIRVKFGFLNELDYLLIEGVFHYVKNKNPLSHEIDFYDNLCTPNLSLNEVSLTKDSLNERIEKLNKINISPKNSSNLLLEYDSVELYRKKDFILNKCLDIFNKIIFDKNETNTLTDEIKNIQTIINDLLGNNYKLIDTNSGSKKVNLIIKNNKKEININDIKDKANEYLIKWEDLYVEVYKNSQELDSIPKDFHKINDLSVEIRDYFNSIKELSDLSLEEQKDFEKKILCFEEKINLFIENNN